MSFSLIAKYSCLLSAVVTLFTIADLQWLLRWRKGLHSRSILLSIKAQHSSRSKRSAPSAINRARRPGLEFWAQRPIYTSSAHLRPTIRWHMALSEFWASTKPTLSSKHAKFDNICQICGAYKLWWQVCAFSVFLE